MAVGKERVQIEKLNNYGINYSLKIEMLFLKRDLFGVVTFDPLSPEMT